YVARTVEHPDDPTIPVKAIKIYFADFWNPAPENVAAGQDMVDPTQYQIFYMGEYDGAGKLSEACLKIKYDRFGVEQSRTQDPYLYWQIPIVRASAGEAARLRRGLPGGKVASPRTPDRYAEDNQLFNFLHIHAGDRDRNPEEVP